MHHEMEFLHGYGSSDSDSDEDDAAPAAAAAPAAVAAAAPAAAAVAPTHGELRDAHGKAPRSHPKPPPAIGSQPWVMSSKNAPVQVMKDAATMASNAMLQIPGWSCDVAGAAAMGAGEAAGVGDIGVFAVLFVGACAAHVFGRWCDHHRSTDFKDYDKNHPRMADDFQSYKFCPLLSFMKDGWLFKKMMVKWESYGEKKVVKLFSKQWFGALCSRIENNQYVRLLPHTPYTRERRACTRWPVNINKNRRKKRVPLKSSFSSLGTYLSRSALFMPVLPVP